MTFTPTAEQTAVVTAAETTTDNLLVNALAGAAKTSTLVLVAQALRKQQMMCLAFNKKIADEMKERLPPNCESLTLNSLGHRAWAQHLGGRRLNVDAKKTYRLLSEAIDKLKDPKEKSFAFENFADLMRNVDFGKACGWVPDNHFPQAKRLMTDDEFYGHLDEKLGDLERDLIHDVTVAGIREALQGTIDFGDQLFMPTLWGAVFPYYPVVLIDEAQDLSALNHFMLRRVAKKRLIAVGDPNQSIYGFRGAHEDSMQKLKADFSMVELSLTISFRCPIKVVEEARWRAPAMQYPEWAKPGGVDRLHQWDVTDVPSQSVAILCRNNAPLFSMALKLLRDGRYPELVGNDLGRSLIKILKKLGPASMKQVDAVSAIQDWGVARLEKARNPDRINDQVACLLIFAREGKTLGEAIDYAERILSVSGPVKLMTIHKSKGLEFDTVFILDRELIRTPNPQENNLLYVAQTRAKDRLIYVDSAHYFSEREDSEERAILE